MQDASSYTQALTHWISPIQEVTVQGQDAQIYPI